MAAKESAHWQNDLYARCMKEQHNLKGLVILITVVQVNKYNGNRPESIDLRINPECFANLINDYIILMERS